MPGGGLSNSIVPPVDRPDAYYWIWTELRNKVFAREPGFFLAQYLREFESALQRFESVARDLLAVTRDSEPAESPPSADSGPMSGSNVGDVL